MQDYAGYMKANIIVWFMPIKAIVEIFRLQGYYLNQLIFKYDPFMIIYFYLFNDMGNIPLNTILCLLSLIGIDHLTIRVWGFL